MQYFKSSIYAYILTQLNSWNEFAMNAGAWHQITKWNKTITRVQNPDLFRSIWDHPALCPGNNGSWSINNADFQDVILWHGILEAILPTMHYSSKKGLVLWHSNKLELLVKPRCCCFSSRIHVRTKYYMKSKN